MSSVFDDLKNSFNKTGNGLNQIILINVIAFVVFIFLKVILTVFQLGYIFEAIEEQLVLPANFQDFIHKPWTLLTYFFLHSTNDFFHILFNMVFLYWFGLLIVEFLGSKRLISLYMLGGLFSGLIFLLIFNTVPYFIDRSNITLIGASGAVYAVVVGAAVLIPDYTFFLIFLGPIKIKWIAALYLLISFAGSIGANAGGNIAHLGGALFGVIYIWQLKNGNDLGKPVIAIGDFFSNLFKPKPKIKITYKNPEKKRGSTASDVSQEEIDEILDKINKYGYEKLTKEEKQKLFKASQSTHIN